MERCYRDTGDYKKRSISYFRQSPGWQLLHRGQPESKHLPRARASGLQDHNVSYISSTKDDQAVKDHFMHTWLTEYGFIKWHDSIWASLGAQMVKNLPAMWKIQVQSLGGEDCLEKGMAIHSSILAWTIPWTEEPGGLQSMGSQRVRYDWATNMTVFTTEQSPQQERRKVTHRGCHPILCKPTWKNPHPRRAD